MARPLAVASAVRLTVVIYVDSASVIDMDEMTAVLTPGQRRTAAARAKRSRLAEDSKAAALRARGWACLPPEAMAALPEQFRLLVLALGRENDVAPPAT